ncbi:hypothetical protein BX600DRAFT_508116 [Xylariales sp. PMI_506]|nr:hypothetical protein BX600DRAFT_508116 [Xylariales sp. PMI_506]
MGKTIEAHTERVGRFISDNLQFTGIDLGDVRRSRRRAYAYHPSGDEVEDDSTEETEESSEEESEGGTGDSDEKEDALVQSALSRIRRAQERGKQEVKLNRKELAALERRRKRLQAEAEAAARRNASSGSGSDRRRRREQRYSVPLSQFEATSSRRRGYSTSDETLPRQTPPSSSHSQGRPGPQMGLFPPPNASRTRPRSGTSSSTRPPSGHESSSPFDYSYVSAQRHASDSSARTSSSRPPYPTDDDGDWRPNSSSSRDQRDPFLYQTAGPRAPYVSGAAAARRNFSGPPGVAYSSVSRKAVPAAARSSSDTSLEEEEGDDTTSDDLGNGAHIPRSRPSADAIIIEEASPSPEPEPERPKSKRKGGSPTKRKPVAGTSNGGGGGSGSSRRRRGK